MKFAVMQPYFMPYIGYFQLMQAADVFVVYDNVQFIKNGWINRNRFLNGGEAKFFTVPVTKGTHDDLISERHIASKIWLRERKKLCVTLRHAYRKAPYFDEVFPMLESCISFETEKIFPLVEHSLLQLHQYLDIQTKIVNASGLAFDQSLKAKHRLFSISKKLNIKNYINPEGGGDLYDVEDFRANGLNLSFLRPQLSVYQQFGNDFVPGLSIIDVLMFNDKVRVQQMLDEYELV